MDASRKIGTGHMMRCLALANEAKQCGWECNFVLRDPESEIVKFISSFEHRVEKLLSLNDCEKFTSNATAHGHWLPVSQIQDANETVNVIHELKPDWIIVDHYALDASWFCIAKKCIAKILVIDDLGDRDIICDILLDQNLGASAEKYDGKLPINCRLFLGPTYALLRSEFREWRERSLEGRLDRNIENILCTSNVRCLVIMTFRHQFIYSAPLQLYSDNVAYSIASSAEYSIDIDQLLLFDIE